MPFTYKVNLISFLITIFIFFPLIRHVQQSGVTRFMKGLSAFAVLLFSLLLWVILSMVIYSPMGNLLYSDPDVPCYILNENNCAKRPDCRPDIFFGGMGIDSFICNQR